MVIKGSVEDIIFHNEENGYTVIMLDVENEPVTLTGSFVNVTEGMFITAEGEFKNGKYGEQFVATKIEISSPTDLDSITRFLASGIIKGIGEKTAMLITNEFGEETLSVIENEPYRLAEIKGISENKAVKIASSYKEIKGMQNMLISLQKYDIGTKMAVKIFKVHGDKTYEIVTKKPYSLVETVQGIGFRTADMIASKVNIEPESVERIRAGIIYILKDVIIASGSTFAFLETLKGKIYELLNIRSTELDEKIEQILLELDIEDVVKRFNVNGVQAVSFKKYYDYEKEIAEKLINLKENVSPLHLDLKQNIEEYESVNKLKLHKTQKEAIEKAVFNGVFVLTGGPGTGKTTIVNCIVSILEKRGLNIELTAPTGRASKRLSLLTEREAKTVHRLLGSEFDGENITFKHNRYNKLKADVVILDEASMMDVFLMRSLLVALKENARLILVGDKDQLPSVSAGNILSDIIESGKIDVTSLTEIYRQEKDSLITINAHKINKGEMPIIDNKNADFFFTRAINTLNARQNVLTMYTERIPKFKGISSKDIQVLSPTKKGELGTNALNTMLQDSVNPKKSGVNECTIGETIFREGDKVIHTVNNYELSYKEYVNGMVIDGQGIFNGDIGYINKIDNKSMTLQVVFEDGKVAVYSFGDAKELSLAYAISVHKSQGSEFDVVILVAMKGYKNLFTKNLLYTAVTRAKSMIVIISSLDTIKYMVENNYIEKRYSLLKDFLISYE